MGSQRVRHDWMTFTSLGWEWKLTFSFPVATAELSKFAGILSVALSQNHLLGFENSSAGIPSPLLALFLVKQDQNLNKLLWVYYLNKIKNRSVHDWSLLVVCDSTQNHKILNLCVSYVLYDPFSIWLNFKDSFSYVVHIPLRINLWYRKLNDWLIFVASICL